MHNPNHSQWTAGDREGFRISREMSEKLMKLGASPGQVPGLTVAELLARYGERAMLYRIAALAAHANSDRVLAKLANFTGGDGSARTGALIALIGRDGRRAIALELSSDTSRVMGAPPIDRAEILFVSPEGSEMPALVEPGAARLGVFFIAGDQLAYPFMRRASRIRASFSGETIFETALDGDFTKTRGVLRGV